MQNLDVFFSLYSALMAWLVYPSAALRHSRVSECSLVWFYTYLYVVKKTHCVLILPG